MGKVARFAPLAGVSGSVLGMMLDLMILAIQPGFNADHIAAWPIIWLFTIFFTVPACFVIGTPVIFLLRDKLITHQFLSTTLVTGIGTLIGWLCFSWLLRPYGDEQILLLTCSGSSAFSFAALYILND